MNNLKLNVPQFESSSYSERAASFFASGQEWIAPQEPIDTHRQWLTRTVTWAHHPYRYWVRQLAEQQSHLFKRLTLNHRMFEVALMSAARTVDGLHEREQWSIVQSRSAPEKLFHTQQLIGDLDKEEATGAVKKDLDFVLDNGLYVPNTEDLAKLDNILEQGYMDGFETWRGDGRGQH